MGKNKTVKEKDVLKALNELEDMVKGDAMEEQDPEGGLSTEGKPLSNKAPSGKGAPNMGKAMASSEDASSVDKADAASDDESDDEGSDDESSPDEDSSDEEEPMGKSFRNRADEDEEMAKGLMVSPFLEAMTDQLSSTMEDLGKSLTAVLDNRISKSEAAQHEFNVRLAKGVVVIGKRVEMLTKSLADFQNSLGNQPHVPQRKSVLNKSEIAEPHQNGENGDDGDQPRINHKDMEEWLINKAQSGDILPVHVTVWEQNNRNPASLPLPIRKAMMNDLAKAH